MNSRLFLYYCVLGDTCDHWGGYNRVTVGTMCMWSWCRHQESYRFIVFWSRFYESSQQRYANVATVT